MSDVVLRIQTIGQQATEGVRAFKAEVLEANRAAEKLSVTNRETGESAVAAARKQIAAEQEKVKVLREQIAVAREVTSSYERGSEARQLATKAEIDLQRKLQASLGETAVVSSRAAKSTARSIEERDASGFARGAASRSGVVGAGLSALAGPGFIAGAVTAGAIDYGVKAAEHEQVAQANLANALKDVGDHRERDREQLEKYAKSQEELTGFERGDVEQTLSQLIRSTGSLSKARQDEAVMANIARARTTDLAGAQMLVLRASMGNVGALRRLGIDIPKVTTHVDALKAAHLSSNVALEKHAKALDLAATKTEVMQAVTQKFTGASASYMHTFAGETARLHNQFHDLEVTIGEKSIPILIRLFDWLSKETAIAEKSKNVHKALHDVAVLLGLAWRGVTAMVEAAKPVLEWLARELEHHRTLAKALAITLGVLFTPLIIAVPIAIGYIVEKWSAIRHFFKTLWDDIQAVFFVAWDNMKIGAVNAVLAIIEPFSHLPGGMGKWARDMKDTLHDELMAMRSDAARQAAIIGGTSGKAMFDAFSPWMAQITASGTNAISGIGGFQPGGAHARGGTPAGSGSPGGSKPTSFAGDTIVRTARGQLGIPYQFGGAQILGHPTDCAGLAHAVLASVGIHIGTTSEQQWTQGTPVKWGDLQPGDLVFFDTHDKQTPPSHVGIYIGNGQFIEDPHTGASVRVSSLMSGYYHENYMGARRYIKATKPAGGGSGDPGANSGAHGGGTTPPKPAPQTAADAAFQRQLKAAQDAAAAAKAAKGGLKSPSLTGLRGAIDAELKAAPDELDAVERNAIAHIKALRAQLHVGMSSDELAKDKVELAKWGKVLRDEIAKNTKGAAAAARAHAKEVKAAAAEVAKAFAAQWQADTAIIDRAINEQWANVQKTYDRETTAHLTQMQRKAAQGIQDMQRAFALQMRDFDRETQRGLDALSVAQTPEEKALADFQQARQDAQDAQAMQDAISSGDPAQILQAQLDQQEKALQKSAEQSRAAQDAKTAADQQAYQDQRDALKQSLEDDENTREQARQDTYDADQQAYQDQRDAQWQHLQDRHDEQATQFDADLKQWETWLQTKKKSWAAFLGWLQSNPISKGFDPSAIINPANAPSASSTLPGTLDPGIAAFLGQSAPRPTPAALGDADAVSRFLTGQAAGGGGGGTTTVYQTNVYNPTVLGATAQQVGSALEQLVTPQQARTTRYNAPF